MCNFCYLIAIRNFKERKNYEAEYDGINHLKYITREEIQQEDKFYPGFINLIVYSITSKLS